MLASTTMASSAAAENHAMLRCPCGITTKAASKGPRELPALPPTWNTAGASPCRPPDAMRATREDSGWKIDDPQPTSAAATSNTGKLPAIDINNKPHSVKPMPTGSEYGFGCLSVYKPTSGCSNDAVIW